MHNTNIEKLPQSSTEKPTGLAARMLALDPSNRGKLMRAFHEGQAEFDDTLDDLAYDAAMQLPEYVDGAAKLKNGQLKTEEAEKLAAHQRELFDEIRHTLILESGVPVVEALADREKARLAVHGRVNDLDSNASENDYLQALNILQKDDQGEPFYTYPADLFPGSMNQKWNTYIETVHAHLAAEKPFSRGEIAGVDFDDINAARIRAHDAITSDIHEALGFSLTKDSNWQYEDTRRLVGKMRDRKFVGQDVREAAIANRALKGATDQIGMLAVRLLTQKSSKR